LHYDLVRYYLFIARAFLMIYFFTVIRKTFKKMEESNGKLPPCVYCPESDNGSLSSPRVVLDLMKLSTLKNIYIPLDSVI